VSEFGPRPTDVWHTRVLGQIRVDTRQRFPKDAVTVGCRAKSQRTVCHPTRTVLACIWCCSWSLAYSLAYSSVCAYGDSPTPREYLSRHEVVHGSPVLLLGHLLRVCVGQGHAVVHLSEPEGVVKLVVQFNAPTSDPHSHLLRLRWSVFMKFPLELVHRCCVFRGASGLRGRPSGS
jgi:hypothetical protein